MDSGGSKSNSLQSFDSLSVGSFSSEFMSQDRKSVDEKTLVLFWGSEGG